jgi:hypothetical protein
VFSELVVWTSPACSVEMASCFCFATQPSRYGSLVAFGLSVEE